MNLLITTVIYNIINAVAISFALIILLRAVIHFVPIVDFDHVKRSPVASAVFVAFVILTFIVFCVVGIG